MTFRTRRFQSPAIFGAAAGGGGGGGFALVAGGTANTANTAATTVDFGSLAFTAGCTRVIVCVQWYTGGTVTGITGANGVTFSQISSPSAAHIAGGGVAADVWISSGAPTGSTIDINLTWSVAQSYGASVQIYSLTTTTPAAADVKTATGLSTSYSVTANIPAGGGGLALTSDVNGNTVTWTNAATDTDAVSNGGVNQYYAHTTATGASIVITGTFPVNANGVLLVVSWAP